MQKKKWEKPKLIVLVRGDSMQGVLLQCKTQDEVYGSGPTNSFHSHCYSSTTYQFAPGRRYSDPSWCGAHPGLKSEFCNYCKDSASS